MKDATTPPLLHGYIIIAKTFMSYVYIYIYIYIYYKRMTFFQLNDHIFRALKIIFPCLKSYYLNSINLRTFSLVF